MSNQKITQLTQLTDVQKESIVLVIADPAGTPASKKVTVSDLLKATNTLNALGTVNSIDVLLGVADPAGTPTPVKITTQGLIEDVTGVTLTTFGYVDPTSSIQTQLNAKEGSITTLSHEKGGLETDVSAYGGLVHISGGSTSAKTIGIADNNIVEMDDADAVDNDYAKFTANGIEGRSYTEAKEDLSLNNVDNTSDVNKPVSTAQQAALDLKAGLADTRNHAKGQIISNIYDICSDPAHIKGLWIFDQNGASTTLNDRGPQGHDATLSANGSTLSPSINGMCPNLDLTSGAYFEVADDDDFSFGDGATDSAFTLIYLGKPNSNANKAFIAKRNTTTGDEYFFSYLSNKLTVRIYDFSTGGYKGRLYNTSLTDELSKYHVYISTYSGSGLSSGCKIYRDGVNVDDTDSESGSYTAMENLPGTVGNFFDSSGGKSTIADSQYGIVAIIAEELTAAKVKQISQTLLAYAGDNLL